MKTPIKYFLKSIADFSKKSFDIIVEGEKLHFDPPEKISIDPSFFREFNCKRCCVCCQKGISPLVYSESERDLIETQVSEASQKLSKGLKNFEIQVSGIKENLYLYEFEGYRCGFDNLMEGDDIWGCDLHFLRLKPLLCLLPWVRISKHGNTARISKRPFGFTWAFGCRASWGKGFSKEQFLNHDIEILERMISIAEDLKIETFLPEIKNVLMDWYKNYLEGNSEVPKNEIILKNNNFVQSLEKYVKDNRFF